MNDPRIESLKHYAVNVEKALFESANSRVSTYTGPSTSSTTSVPPTTDSLMYMCICVTYLPAALVYVFIDSICLHYSIQCVCHPA